MSTRTFQPGDETAQVSIYNEAAAELPKFKPASVDEVRRRCRAADFDPATRLYAIEDGRPVAYATFQPNGRVSFPWCRKDREHWAGPLFDQVLDALRGRGVSRAFAAYRADWEPVRDFFVARGFVAARQMLNFILDLVEMPTPAARLSSSVTPLMPADLPALAQMGPDVIRAGPEELERWLFHNPYFPPRSLFALRSRAGGQAVAAGILVLDSAYANPRQLDAAMPCFRLGAFGAEGMTAKRVNGLFSFVVADPRETGQLGLDLMSHAASMLQDTDLETLAAQVPSDAGPLTRFYQQTFRPQGSFPLYERVL